MDIHQPHDKFFKALFSHQDIVADLIGGTIERQLGICFDMTTLRPDPNDYHTDYLASLFSDVVYECQLKDSANSLKINLLWEHKSSFKPGIKFDFLDYCCEIWRFQRNQQQEKTPIICIIFSHGTDGWRTDGHELLFENLPPQLQAFMPALSLIHI